ncbi:MAG: crotonase/enoyl-CoA hydratase family protein [Sporichthyaceae bacterium]
MTTTTVTTETTGAVVVVTLNRPAARNCIDRETAEGVAAALDALDSDPALAVGILTGAGGGFSAGMDLKAFARGELPVAGDRGFAGLVARPPRKPLVCAVEGFALAGGLEIALACDVIVAARDARLGLPEVSRGLIAGAGGLWRLPRRVGMGQASLLTLTGTPVDAAEAHRIGLVDVLAEPGQALAEARALAAVVAGNAPLALAATKQVLDEGFGRSADEFWTGQKAHLKAVLASADAREGAVAFAEKRPPQWRGR